MLCPTPAAAQRKPRGGPAGGPAGGDRPPLPDSGGVRCLGIDLAWGERARTGLAALDPSGVLVASTSVVTDDEIAAFVQRWARVGPGDGLVAAVDAPLVVPNLTGRRPCEAQVSAAFGRFFAGAYPANRANPAFAPEPRGARLARRFGWSIDPGTVIVPVDDPRPGGLPAPGDGVAVRAGPGHPLQAQGRAGAARAARRLRPPAGPPRDHLRRRAAAAGSPPVGRSCGSPRPAPAARASWTGSRTRSTRPCAPTSPGSGCTTGRR